MLPKIDGIKDIEFIKNEHNTYKMNLYRPRILGQQNDLSIMEQAIYKIVNTERFNYVIYSGNYGIELEDLFGKPMNYVEVEVKRRISEALLNDDRITDIVDFSTNRKNKNTLEVTFTANTIYGNLNISKEVFF